MLSTFYADAKGETRRWAALRLNWLHREGSSAIAKAAKLLRGDQTQAVERSDINGERSTRSSETKKREKRYKRERSPKRLTHPIFVQRWRGRFGFYVKEVNPCPNYSLTEKKHRRNCRKLRRCSRIGARSTTRRSRTKPFSDNFSDRELPFSDNYGDKLNFISY
jgi:hypothetical protein